MNKHAIQLVREIQEGNETAFEELYQEIYMDVYRMAFSICKDHNDANDILQESFLSLSKTIYSLKDPESFPLWLKRVVFSRSTRHFRKNKYFAMSDEQMRTIPNLKEENKSFLAEENFYNTSEKELIHGFVMKLRPKLQDVVKCVYFQQMSLEETSMFLNRPLGTVKSQLHSARGVLQEVITKFERENNRKVYFHDLGAPVVYGVFSFAFWKSKVQAVFRKPIVLNSVLIGSTVMFTTLSYEGVQTITQRNDDIATLEKVPQTSHSANSFYARFQGKEITSAQDAYFTILKWGGSPELAIEKSQQEIKEIQELMLALKTHANKYWERLNKDGWNILLM